MGKGGYKSAKQKRWLKKNQPALAAKWDKYYGKLLDARVRRKK